MSDTVELSFPVRADLIVLARLTTAALAAQSEFGIEDVEDLRLAVDELCLAVIGDADSGEIGLRFTRDHDLLTVECELRGADGGRRAETGMDDLSIKIIEALVDDYGTEVVDGLVRGWIRKQARPGPA